MERLTKRLVSNGTVVFTQGKYEETIPAEMTNDDIRAVLKKLADYEYLEEQGLLVRLPCPIGTTVWDICGIYVPEGNELICAKKAKRANRARPVSKILLMMFRSANRDYRKAVKQLEGMKKNG